MSPLDMVRLARENSAEPAVAADGAGMTAFRRVRSLRPAPLLNFIVRHRSGPADAFAIEFGYH